MTLNALVENIETETNDFFSKNKKSDLFFKT